MLVLRSPSRSLYGLSRNRLGGNSTIFAELPSAVSYFVNTLGEVLPCSHHFLADDPNTLLDETCERFRCTRWTVLHTRNADIRCPPIPWPGCNCLPLLSDRTTRLWCAVYLFVYVPIRAADTEDTQPPTIKFLAGNNGDESIIDLVWRRFAHLR